MCRFGKATVYLQYAALECTWSLQGMQPPTCWMRTFHNDGEIWLHEYASWIVACLMPHACYAAGGDLYEELKRSGGQLKECRVALDIIQPCLSALSYMHSMVSPQLRLAPARLGWSLWQPGTLMYPTCPSATRFFGKKQWFISACAQLTSNHADAAKQTCRQTCMLPMQVHHQAGWPEIRH